MLSEGLNLQDATRLINYDLHWNPVRLMQRVGRVDRRLSTRVEEKLVADHPEQQPLRGTVSYWNAFVANLEMHGKGTFFDPRLDDAAQFPIAAAHHLGHVVRCRGSTSGGSTPNSAMSA